MAERRLPVSRPLRESTLRWGKKCYNDNVPLLGASVTRLYTQHYTRSVTGMAFAVVGASWQRAPVQYSR